MSRLIKMFIIKLAISIFKFVVLVCLAPTLLADTVKDIQSGHVYQNVQVLENKISKLALLMGVSLKQDPFLAPENIYPRDVYYQGLTIYKKVSRVRYEFTRLESDKIKSRDKEYQPKHVHKLMTKTHVLMDDIINYIYLNYELKEDDVNKIISVSARSSIKLDIEKKPKDVFSKLVVMNRKLNQLLDFRFTPADTFEQVTLAISYASAILQTISNEQTIYEPSPLLPGKSPNDVYAKLTSVHHKLYECLSAVNVMTAQISEKIYSSSQVEPSDVYDLTNLILSNLAYLHRNLDEQVRPRPTYYPGKTLPSVVYQRVTILEKQVDAIHQLRQHLKMK